MTYKLCISVAVSNAEKVEKLPGALHSATEMLGWASAAGFDTLRLDDSAAEVTAELLKQKLQPLLLDDNRTVDHLIFHFAGHGIASGVEDQFMLLSNWRSRPTEAIKLSLFVRLLQYYQIGRVSLFIDACRSRPSDEAEDVHGTGVLDRPDEKRSEFLEDRFRAVAHSYQTFMIKGDETAPPRCLFSNVLVRGLCGEFQEAVASRNDRSVVTSGKLYQALTKHLPIEAARYHLDQTPSLRPQFVEPDDVYTVLPIGFKSSPLPPGSQPGSGTFESLKNSAIEGFDMVRNGLESLTIRAPDHQLPSAGRGKLPPSASPARRRQFDRDFRRFVKDYRTEVFPNPKDFRADAGLAFNGGAAIELLGAPGISFSREKDTNWWRVEFKPAPTYRMFGDFAVQIEGGTWVAGAALRGNILGISLERRGEAYSAVSAIYRPLGDGEGADEVSKVSEETIALLRAGALTSDRALSVAANIRLGKHINPMLGVLAAYLYDAAGDRDSIRRTAWFYAYYGQPIPFDIALLADLKGKKAPDGSLTLTLPAVSQREPSTPEERLHPDYFKETDARDDVPVAGHFPWLRQGWPLLTVTELPVHASLVDMTNELLPAPFTTLKPDAGKRLADLVKTGGF